MQHFRAIYFFFFQPFPKMKKNTFKANVDSHKPLDMQIQLSFLPLFFRVIKAEGNYEERHRGPLKKKKIYQVYLNRTTNSRYVEVEKQINSLSTVN